MKNLVIIAMLFGSLASFAESPDFNINNKDHQMRIAVAAGLSYIVRDVAKNKLGATTNGATIIAVLLVVGTSLAMDAFEDDRQILNGGNQLAVGIGSTAGITLHFLFD